MASSRWKRFGFFDRHTLNLPSAVLDDLLPDSSLTGSGRRAQNETVESDDLCLVVTTAGLPANLDSGGQRTEGDGTAQIAQDMMSALTACAGKGDSVLDDTMIQLPGKSYVGSKARVRKNDGGMDGLVLSFVSSAESDLVHCIDLTVRCSSNNPPEEKLELDGWRGYWTPFAAPTPSTAGTGKNVEDRIIAEHLQESGSGTTSGERLAGLATTRNDQGQVLVACISDSNVTLQIDPHLHLSCRLPVTTNKSKPKTIPIAQPWNTAAWGHCTAVDMVSAGHVAVGTDTGTTVLYSHVKGFLRQWMVIPPPGNGQGLVVANLQLCTYKSTPEGGTSQLRLALFASHTKGPIPSAGRVGVSVGGGGLCCYDLGPNIASASAPLGRHDLDSRPGFLVDCIPDSNDESSRLMVARPDGLYTYSPTQKVGVAPIEGTKLAICAVPSLTTTAEGEAASAYALVASTDIKSGRDAVDIYDATNKLVAFHVLLSPGHRALRAAGVRSRSGRSSAIVVSSGGSVVTLTEKDTDEKVSLLVQKNLYGAAISMAYADPIYPRNEITNLYCKHAEHLYRKGDFTAAMEQYIYTIGSLESSHVILRYLDAPKIPMLAKYLEELRNRKLATPVHNELLRTCYLKLNDNEAADKLLAQRSAPGESAVETISNLTHNPKEALATLCTLNAPQAAEALMVHGAALARAAPKETAGIVVSLCVGTYSPAALAEAAEKADSAARLLEYALDERTKQCEPYPVHLFTAAFLENPKVLRLVLAHCNRNKCYLTPTLRRTLLELTLDEWKAAGKNGDTEAEKLRRKEAITALTDAHCREIGDYDALVIVQLAGFAEGELLLYERLQMVPMLLARYAEDGGDRARRQMLAMCRKDPQILADVLGHFVSIAGAKIDHDRLEDDGGSVNSEEEEILDDIREALTLARSQGVLPPVRIARILAGEGVGQFRKSASDGKEEEKNTVPLSVALDYVGDFLDESRKEISRLRAEVEEYNELCNKMEGDIDSLLSGIRETNAASKKDIDIDEMYARLRTSMEESGNASTIPPSQENRTLQAREAFWREMNQSEDRFETICKFFSKGIIQ